MKNFLIIILLFPLITFSQEQKRLALVIGNANYDEGTLKNPVNDALLVKQTLVSLGFDVILDTNISNNYGFTEKVAEFGERRENYDVGLVFYAGHAIQVGAENFLLPTKVNFKKVNDVRLKGFSVQQIMLYLESYTNQVNILILDACRDNPFERNWNRTRSLKGAGLAKIQAPTGSLIAFSTDAGNTAADGEGKNSIYCKSLCENMKKENTTLDQVFRNVRADVLSLSNGDQRPVESSQLTGDAFYLVPSNYENDFLKVEQLIKKRKYLKSNQILSKIIALDPKNIRAYLLQGKTYRLWRKYDEALQAFQKVIDFDPRNISAFLEKTKVYEDLEEYNKSIDDLNKIILIDSLNADIFNRRGIVYAYYLDSLEKGLADFNKSISLDTNFAKAYSNRADVYAELKKNEQAIFNYNYAILLSSDKKNTAYSQRHIFFENRAAFFRDNNDYKNALKDFNTSIDIDPLYITSYLKRGDLYYLHLKNNDKALADFNFAISLDKENALSYYYRSAFYYENKDYDKSILDLSRCIDLKPEDADYYNFRALIYTDMKKYDLALQDYSTALELSDNLLAKTTALNDRAVVYAEQEKYELAIQEYTKAIELDPTSHLYYRNRAVTYSYNLNDTIKANADFSKSIELIKKKSDESYHFGDDVAYYYYNRAYHFEYHLDYENAIKDINQCLALDTENSEYYDYRAGLYSKMGNKDLALVDYNRALEFSKDLDEKTTVLNNRAIIYSSQKKYELAIKEYTKAIELDSTLPLLYLNRAKAYFFNLNDTIKALNDFNKSVELAKKKKAENIDLEDDLDYYYLSRGYFYFNNFEYVKALNDYSAGIDLNPDEPENYFYRAELYSEMQLFDLALQDYHKEFELRKSLLDKNSALNSSAKLYIKQEKYELAIEEYTKVIQLNSTEPLPYSNRARVYFYNLNDTINALNDFNMSVELAYQKSADSTDIAFNLDYYLYERASFFQKNNDYEKALLDYTSCIALNPDETDYYTQRANVYAEMQNYDLALADLFYLKDILDTLSSYVYLVSISMIYKDLKEYNKALNSINLAIGKDSLNSSAYFIRSKIFNELGEFEKGKSDLLKTIKIDTEDPEGYYYLALYYLNNNNFYKSLYFLNKSIDKLSLGDYYISGKNFGKKVILSDLFLKIADIYSRVEAFDLACENYKLACDNGDCKLFDENCK